jgi:hypothetical protein
MAKGQQRESFLLKFAQVPGYLGHNASVVKGEECVQLLPGMSMFPGILSPQFSRSTVLHVAPNHERQESQPLI